MSKSKQQIGADVRKAFEQWMSGTPFVVVKTKVGRPLMATFAQLAGAPTWRAAKAARDKSVRAAKAKVAS